MARISAAVQLDPDRVPEQLAFLRERVTVLREAGGQYWVSLEEQQVDTLVRQGMEVSPQPGADVVELPAVVFRPPDERPEPPAGLAAEEPAGDALGYYLVHFRAPIDKNWLNDIAAVGGEFVQAVPNQAAVFRFSRAQADAVRGLEYVDSVGVWQPAYAVSPDVAGAEAPFSAASLRNLSPGVPADAPEGNLTVRGFDGLNPEELRAPLEAAGATIVEQSAHGFRIRAPQARVTEILRVPGIFAVELPTRKRLFNSNAGVVVGANEVRSLGTVDFLVNLEGTGEIGAVVDSGFDVGNLAGATPPPTGVPTPFHPDLVTNLRLLRNSNNPQNAALTVPDPDPHGTHVAGTIAGDGSSSAGQIRGMAPRASLLGLAPLPNNVRVPFEFAFVDGARVINNSWGSSFLVGVTNNRYTPGEAQPVDRWCFDHPEVLVLFAAGNDERDVVAGGDGVLDARTLGLEATAKNAMTVGASENLRNNGGWRDNYRTAFPGRYNHAAFNATAGGAAGAFTFSDNADEVALFSDRGRVRTNGGANTQRVKPDVVAPGTNVLSCRSQWIAPPPAVPPAPIPAAFYNLNSDSMLPAGINRNLYQIFDGTSMATPMTAGAALLARQYYRTRFAQLRRPLLLEGAVVPAAAPLPTFGGRPSLAPHADGLVFAWVSPDLPANPRRVVATRLSRRLAPVDAAPVQLQAAVGDRAEPRVARRGERTYLLHRHADNTMRLSSYDRALQAEAGFGAGGVVTLAPNARPDPAVAPDLLVVGDHVACAFPAAGGNAYVLRRFRADTGAAVDAAAVEVLSADHTGAHRCVVHTGARYTVCGVSRPGNQQLQVRQMTNAGALVGAAPATIVAQAAELRDPCILWDPRSGGRHVLVWCDARTQAGGELYVLTLNAQAVAQGAPHRVVTVPAGRRMRRPRILPHPEAGYFLAWEDDSQDGSYDLYVAFLDDALNVDGRLPSDPSDALGRRLLRVSDTPENTDGFAAVRDAGGLSLVYQSPDEINSDRLGVYAVNLTPGGAFEAQEDPNTPWLRSGRYVTAQVLEHDSPALTPVSAVWAGGVYYLVRQRPDVGVADRIDWLRLNADGLLDAGHGVDGVRTVSNNLLITGCDLLWTGSRLVTAVNDVVGGIFVHFADDQGVPVPTFGTAGTATLADTVAIDTHVPPQLGFFTSPALRVTVAYGSMQGGALRLRYQRLDARGVRVGNPVNLAQASGVAAHGWFQFVNSESRALAIYHRVDGAVTRVYCRRFQPDGTADGGERTLSAAAGEAINGVTARRPTAVNSPNREYGAVWQYRATDASRWEIRFSRLSRSGQPMANPPAPAPPAAVRDIPVISAGPDWPADRDAVEPQLVSTYTHEPWANPPAPLPPGTSLPRWSPAYGLAWVGVHPDGSRILYFTVLDENGQRLRVPQPPPPAGPFAAAAPVPLLQVSATGSAVRDFALVWNGRVFLLTWTEEEAGRVRHRCTLVNRHANQVAHDLPSAALLRATLVNGATNITRTSLPDTATGYGWGRVNLRQSLAPAPPVTVYARDDCALGPGRTATYRFTLPAGTALLRATVNWTDPPGPRLVNHLHLTVRAPGGAEYRGNLWSAAPNTHLSRPVAVPPTAADNHENVQTFKQVVLDNPPAGVYEVEVSAAPFPTDPFNQQNLQPFALIFQGTGPEVRFGLPVGAVQGAAVY